MRLKIAFTITILLIICGALFWLLYTVDTLPAPEEPHTTNERAYTADENTFYLSVPELGIDRVEVISSNADDEEPLDKSLLHLNDTGYPWEDNHNVFIAGHRLGFPGTDSFRIFYDLPSLEDNDKILIEDSNGREYEYRVYEHLVVEPSAYEVTEPVGKDIVSLQTCTLPAYEDRYIVRGELEE